MTMQYMYVRPYLVYKIFIEFYYKLSNKYRFVACVIQMTSQHSYQAPRLIQVISPRADTDPYHTPWNPSAFCFDICA